jgi:hypothetical protein
VEAVAYCDEARRFERKIEYIYRQALVELFTNNDFKYIFKRREVYRHLSNHFFISTQDLPVNKVLVLTNSPAFLF